METEFNFKLDYFNSTSAKFLVEILVTLSKIRNNGNALKVTWHYYEEDEEMKYAGEELSNLSELPFEFVSYE